MLDIVLFGTTVILCFILGYCWGREDERKAQTEKDTPHD